MSELIELATWKHTARAAPVRVRGPRPSAMSWLRAAVLHAVGLLGLDAART